LFMLLTTRNTSSPSPPPPPRGDKIWKIVNNRCYEYRCRKSVWRWEFIIFLCKKLL